MTDDLVMPTSNVNESRAWIDRHYHFGPGKFEGQGPITAYLYELALLGEGESEVECPTCECCSQPDLFFVCECQVVTSFDVDLLEGKALDVSPGRYLMREDSQGFVSAAKDDDHDDHEYKAWVATVTP